jgi:hypothetical protein
LHLFSIKQVKGVDLSDGSPPKYHFGPIEHAAGTALISIKTLQKY